MLLLAVGAAGSWCWRSAAASAGADAAGREGLRDGTGGGGGIPVGNGGGVILWSMLYYSLHRSFPTAVGPLGQSCLASAESADRLSMRRSRQGATCRGH